jgi:hypothetical protein
MRGYRCEQLASNPFAREVVIQCWGPGPSSMFSTSRVRLDDPVAVCDTRYVCNSIVDSSSYVDSPTPPCSSSIKSTLLQHLLQHRKLSCSRAHACTNIFKNTSPAMHTVYLSVRIAIPLCIAVPFPSCVTDPSCVDDPPPCTSLDPRVSSTLCALLAPSPRASLAPHALSWGSRSIYSFGTCTFK